MSTSNYGRMKQDIGSVSAIKGAIELVLEGIRDIYKADICALFLIMDEMHNDEKLGIFQERLERIKEECDRKSCQLPSPLDQYWKEFKAGGRQSLSKFIEEVDILKFCFTEQQSKSPSVADPDQHEQPARLWKHTYKQRPSKYVIFKNYTEKDKQKSIPFEGLTAYTVRIERDVFIPDTREMNAYPCVTHLNSRNTITPKCEMIAFLLLEDPETKRVIGLVKIENYKEIEEAKCKFRSDSEETKEAKGYLPLLAKLVRKWKNLHNEHSYENLYGGIKLLDLLPDIEIASSQGELNREICIQTRKLFYVLHRREYVGYEEIMTRVTNYADDVADILEIQPKGFFGNLLKRRRDHENLMLYKTAGYRDHFMHQFHVFVIGYIILNHIGLSKVCNYVNNSLQHTKYQSNKLSENSILRIWFFAAFLHDATYVFEKFEEGLAKFFEEEWGHQLDIKLDGAQLLDKEKMFSTHLANMLDVFKCKDPTRNEEILPPLLDSIVKMNDHGVMSALWLLKKFAENDTEERQIECYIAALAVASHNKVIYESLWEEQSGVSFECFPILFLLAFCDTSQVWGRSREIKEYVRPQLLDIQFKQNEVKVQLLYCTNYPDKAPTQRYIRDRLMQGKTQHFRSSETRFSIEFFAGQRNQLRRIDLHRFPAP